MTYLEELKNNLIIENDNDDELLESMLASAISYAEAYQHLYDGYYQDYRMSERTRRAVIMLASHFYESRTGGTDGFFGDSVQAADGVTVAVNSLLRLDRDWQV